MNPGTSHERQVPYPLYHPFGPHTTKLSPKKPNPSVKTIRRRMAILNLTIDAILHLFVFRPPQGLVLALYSGRTGKAQETLRVSRNKPRSTACKASVLPTILSPVSNSASLPLIYFIYFYCSDTQQCWGRGEGPVPVMLHWPLHT